MAKAKRKLLVAIDGPAGSGKSTIARLLAQRLGYRYVDTGAIYRAFTWKVLKDRVPLKSEEDLARVARTMRLRFVQKDGAHFVRVDGEDVTHRIRTERVSQMTSKLSALKPVRRALLARQRRLGRGGGAVVEGRDIGTKVFPDADAKFYLTASALERARRRYHQLKAKGHRVAMKDIAAAIRARDHRDKTRGISPLAPASDAVVLDSTKLAPHEVVDLIVARLRGPD